MTVVPIGSAGGPAARFPQPAQTPRARPTMQATWGFGDALPNR
ncbi:hypothetical protein ACXYX3_05935 [Mycobacterium sp. C3-094]|nr:hypothetical protein [Mycobacterium sp. PSTR-4-N]